MSGVIGGDVYRGAFYICCLISLLVFMVLIYSLIQFRRSEANTPHFHKHLSVEIIWTIIPFLILVLLAMPVTMMLLQNH